MSDSTVLLLEDDRLFGETLVDFLEEEGYRVDHFLASREALDVIFSHPDRYDIYLLDVNVPDLNGFELLGQLRESGDDTPAIYITSATDRSALSRGFANGADDYMKKPLDLEELRLRIEAHLRRARPRSTVAIGDYRFDPERLTLYRDGKVVAMPAKVMELLAVLLRRRGEVVRTEEILETLYGDDIPESGVLRVYINKLKGLFGREAIRNVRGVGYYFEA